MIDDGLMAYVESEGWQEAVNVERREPASEGGVGSSEGGSAERSLPQLSRWKGCGRRAGGTRRTRAGGAWPVYGVSKHVH